MQKNTFLVLRGKFTGEEAKLRRTFFLELKKKMSTTFSTFKKENRLKSSETFAYKIFLNSENFEKKILRQKKIQKIFLTFSQNYYFSL